jgi:hypothetical protein
VLATTASGVTGFSAGKFKLDLSAFENDTTGGRFSLAQSGNDLLLAFTPSLAADFDEDSDVDGDDLTKWKLGFGAGGSASHMQGDADADADVDGADFLAWQRQLGGAAVSASSAAVPEPSSGILLLMGYAAAGALTRRGLLRRTPFYSAVNSPVIGQ